MSKKKNKKKAQKKAQKRFDRARQKNRKNIEKKLKGKTVKATLSEKQAKKLNKILDELSDVPALKEPRKTCNHQGKKNISIVMQDSYDGELFVVKNLEKMNEVFGEDNIGICKKCRVAVPALECIDVEDLDRAHMMLVGAVEHIVTRSEDRKEVELLHKAMKEAEATIKLIRKKFAKVKEKGTYNGGVIDRTTIRTPGNSDGTFVRTKLAKTTRQMADITTKKGVNLDPTIPWWEQIDEDDEFTHQGHTYRGIAGAKKTTTTTVVESKVTLKTPEELGFN